MKHILMTAMLLSTVSSTHSFDIPEPKNKMETDNQIILTILYDNYQYEKDFRNSWGFSCLIEGTGQTILFDTGGRDGNLMHNFRAAGKDPKDVDLIILSHIHWDHTGGLADFLESKSGIDVFVPESFPEEFTKGIEDRGAHPVPVSGARQITEHVWSTGEMGHEIIEQSLVVETGGGLVIITGCAHPGIAEIVKKASEMMNEKILLVMGGFHLLRTGTDEVEGIARDFRENDIQYAAPSHCSGDGTISIFREVFGEKCLELGTGRVIETAAL
jgi:7,8-dihydropterin-6-yl-methyl-4-(beta-D-ribofuranosyl)aminobenzene 5'-phosphate synthase